MEYCPKYCHKSYKTEVGQSNNNPNDYDPLRMENIEE